MDDNPLIGQIRLPAGVHYVRDRLPGDALTRFQRTWGINQIDFEHLDGQAVVFAWVQFADDDDLYPLPIPHYRPDPAARPGERYNLRIGRSAAGSVHGDFDLDIPLGTPLLAAAQAGLVACDTSEGLTAEVRRLAARQLLYRNRLYWGEIEKTIGWSVNSAVTLMGWHSWTVDTGFVDTLLKTFREQDVVRDPADPQQAGVVQGEALVRAVFKEFFGVPVSIALIGRFAVRAFDALTALPGWYGYAGSLV